MLRISICAIILLILLTPRIYAEEPKDEIDTESVLYQMLSGITQQLVSILVEMDSSRTFNVAIMSFDNIGTDAEEMKAGETVSEILIGTFSHYNNITLTERRRLSDIIEEMKLSASGVVSSETAIQVGELAGAEIMITGSVVHAGKYFNINARILYVSSAEVLGATFTEVPDKELIAASSAMYDIGKRPLVASFYSMLLPGMGQIIINDQPTKGGFFLITEATLLSTALILNMQGNKLYEEYEENTYESIEKYDSAQTYYQGANIALGAAGVVWLWNVLDAYFGAHSFNKRVKESSETAKYSTAPKPFLTLDKNNPQYIRIGLVKSF